MDSIDDFLQQLAQQHQEKQQKSEPQSTNNSPTMNSSEDKLDNYLSQLESNHQNDNYSAITDSVSHKLERIHQASTTSPTDNSEELFSAIENKFQQKQSQKNYSEEDTSIVDNSIRQIVKHTQSKIQDSQSRLSEEDSSILDNSIRQIIKHSERQTKQSQAEQTADNLETIRAEELKKQKQIKQLSREAEKWLKNLDPHSEEGFWFEQFALSYESKQVAAMEYLKALKS